MENRILNSLQDTITWMATRYWINHVDKADSIESEFPQKFIQCYWGFMDNNQRESAIIDIEREKNGTFLKTCGNRCDLLFQAIENADKSNIEFDNEFEFSVLRMAILYACPRQTIASASLPYEIITHKYSELTDEQMNIIVCDLNEYLNSLQENNMEPCFGSKTIDDPVWQKFLGALDKSKHYSLKLIDDSEIVAFDCWFTTERKETIPLSSYLQKPYHHIFIPEESKKK